MRLTTWRLRNVKRQRPADVFVSPSIAAGERRGRQWPGGIATSGQSVALQREGRRIGCVTGRRRRGRRRRRGSRQFHTRARSVVISGRRREIAVGLRLLHPAHRWRRSGDRARRSAREIVVVLRSQRRCWEQIGCASSLARSWTTQSSRRARKLWMRFMRLVLKPSSIGVSPARLVPHRCNDAHRSSLCRRHDWKHDAESEMCNAIQGWC